MRIATIVGFIVLAAASGAIAKVATPGIAAKVLFGHVALPTEAAPRSVGGYAKGCLAGAAALPLDGPHWQVMRLSRNRHWGRPELVSYLEKFSADVAEDGWPGLLIGDMSQPRGGPMPTGHASHQIGLDADIWFVPMPDHTLSADEREKKSAVSLLMNGRLSVDPSEMERSVCAAPEARRLLPGGGAHLRQRRDQEGTLRDRRHRPRVASQASPVVGPRRPLPRAARLPIGGRRLHLAAPRRSGRWLRRRA